MWFSAALAVAAATRVVAAAAWLPRMTIHCSKSTTFGSPEQLSCTCCYQQQPAPRSTGCAAMRNGRHALFPVVTACQVYRCKEQLSTTKADSLHVWPEQGQYYCTKRQSSSCCSIFSKSSAHCRSLVARFLVIFVAKIHKHDCQDNSSSLSITLISHMPCDRWHLLPARGTEHPNTVQPLLCSIYAHHIQVTHHPESSHGINAIMACSASVLQQLQDVSKALKTE
jgi:hypothetical protein